ncbi:MAG TPA: ABC transporter permease [Blastocatellia bacterium]|nr:ABC transporter permease [Blastocatellia bacterium]
MSMSLRLIWRFRLRSSLILLSATLGVAGVISSVNYASGGRLQVLNQIRRLGTNVVNVTPQQSRSVSGRARTGSIVTTLVEQDYLAIRRELPSLARSSALATAGFRLKASDFSKTTSVVGCEPDYFRIKSWSLERGDFFEASDLRKSARVAILGHTVARDLFGDEAAVGRRLFINRAPFEVVGVLAELGQGLDVANEDNQVFVPLSTAMRRLMNVEYYSGLVFELDRWEVMDDGAKAIANLLRRRHRSSPKQPEDFQVQNQKELIDTQTASAESLAFFVRWIGLSGLIVSGLGALAISWIAVKERTVEIGARRALGATACDIFFQLLFEAAVVSSLGSAFGLAAGWQSSRLIAEQAHLPFVFDWTNARVALAFAVALNLTFALLPSGKAARLDPIRALKYE